MHELSIANSLVDLTLQMLDRDDVDSDAVVSAIRVRIGEMSGVVPAALEAAFPAAAAATAAQGARLEIEHVSVAVWCDACEREQSLSPPLRLRCTKCGSATPRIVRGQELELVAIELSYVEAPA
jgi:hydrogenase nickel incorporation protein HypA/HybF